jgi:hypothetical protein
LGKKSAESWDFGENFRVIATAAHRRPDGWTGFQRREFQHHRSTISRHEGRLGFNDCHGGYDFHSLRQTGKTMKLQAGVAQWILDTVFGHEHGDAMMHTYAHEATLEQKREAMSKLVFPFPQTY